MRSVTSGALLGLVCLVLGCSKPPQTKPPADQSQEAQTPIESIAAPVSTPEQLSPTLGIQNGRADSGETISESTPPQTQSSETEEGTSDSRQQSTPPQIESDSSNDIDSKQAKATDLPEELTHESHPIEIPSSWQRLGKNEIWVDFQSKMVIIGGYICLRDGALEMFACPANTKEHESVIATNAYASEMHAALLAIEAEPGSPSRWTEEGFTPPHGSLIDIQVRWFDEQSKQEVTRSAKEMVFNVVKQKTMESDWIFGGSVSYQDPETGDKYYVADSGEMICLSNFSTAAIDIQVESTNTNEDLYFRAHTENIPELGTKVYMILKPGQVVAPRED